MLLWTFIMRESCLALADIRALEGPVRSYAQYRQHSIPEISVNVPIS